jgi:hypothetical protein
MQKSTTHRHTQQTAAGAVTLRIMAMGGMARKTGRVGSVGGLQRKGVSGPLAYTDGSHTHQLQQVATHGICFEHQHRLYPSSGCCDGKEASFGLNAPPIWNVVRGRRLCSSARLRCIVSSCVERMVNCRNIRDIDGGSGTCAVPGTTDSGGLVTWRPSIGQPFVSQQNWRSGSVTLVQSIKSPPHDVQMQFISRPLRYGLRSCLLSGFVGCGEFWPVFVPIIRPHFLACHLTV